MVDIERLDNYLMSDDAPENCMQVSDLDGFLTGILCSPDLILPGEWLPVVWNSPEPNFTDEGIWAIQEIMKLYNMIAQGLNADPPHLEPLFWEREGGAVIAMDWCEGFMDAYALRAKQWDELMATEQGQDWMFPILAHLLDDDGNTVSGASKEELPKVLDEAASLIPSAIPRIFTYWQSKRRPSTSNGGTDNNMSASKVPATLPKYDTEELERMSEQELFALLIGHEDRVPMEVIDACAARGETMVPILHQHVADNANWSEGVDIRDWWALLHSMMVLGLIAGKASANSLLEGFRRIAFDGENDLADWFAGYWPALFRNKSQFSTAQLRVIAEDNELDWYPRVNAVECVLADAAEKGTDELDTAVDWVAELVDGEDADPEFRAITVTKLLDFPRERHRALLETIAGEQENRDTIGVAFGGQDVEVAFERDDRPQWLRFENPWQFYAPESIRRRQQRWAEEDRRSEERQRTKQSVQSPGSGESDTSFGVPYVRQDPKIGRNDPCPCGSGNKYKKCCLTRFH